VAVPGLSASSITGGQTGTPVGLGSDLLKIFSVVMKNGKPVLNVSGQIHGGLTTRVENEDTAVPQERITSAGKAGWCRVKIPATR
jgi:hypothetical protein